jgi:hypothetical protein
MKFGRRRRDRRGFNHYLFAVRRRHR